MSSSLEFVLILIELENDFVKGILRSLVYHLAFLLNAMKICWGFFFDIEIYTSDSFRL